MTMTEEFVAKEKKPEPIPAPAGNKPTQDKGEPVSAKLYRKHAKKLAELAREEELEGGSAEAFDKHFDGLLDNLLIAAKAARLRKLQDEQRQ